MRVDAIGFTPLQTTGPRAVVQGEAWEAAVAAQRVFGRDQTVSASRTQPLRKTAFDTLSDLTAE